MELFIGLIFVGVVIYFLFKAQTPGEGDARKSPRRTSPKTEKVDSAEQTTIDNIDGGVRLNTNKRLPIQISGVSTAGLKEVIAGIHDGTHPGELKGRLGLIIAQRNAESPEVEEFLTEIQKRYDRALRTELNREPKYQDWPEADREDFIAEAKEEAVESLEVCTIFEDLEILMTERPTDVTADDPITQQFEGDPDGLYAYLHVCSRKKPVEAQDRKERETLERLADKGLVFRGSEMPVESLLERLRMKDIQRLLGDDAPKKFTRKGDAVSFAAGVSDMRDRIANEQPLRSTFQAKKPSGDVDAAVQALRFAREYAGLIITTLLTEARAQRNIQRGKKFVVEGEDCKFCNVHIDKEVTRQAKKARPPHHVGCTCQFDPVLD